MEKCRVMAYINTKMAQNIKAIFTITNFKDNVQYNILIAIVSPERLTTINSPTAITPITNDNTLNKYTFIFY